MLVLDLRSGDTAVASQVSHAWLLASGTFTLTLDSQQPPASLPPHALADLPQALGLNTLKCVGASPISPIMSIPHPSVLLWVLEVDLDGFHQSGLLLALAKERWQET